MEDLDEYYDSDISQYIASINSHSTEDSDCDQWDYTYYEVKNFILNYGIFPTYGSDRRLSEWIDYQRNLHYFGFLSNDRIKLLELLPLWQWAIRKYDASWNRIYETIKGFMYKNHRLPTCDDNIILVNWINLQKRIYKKGKLCEYRKFLLRMIPGWDWHLKKTDIAWNDFYNQLLDFIHTYNRTPKYNDDQSMWKWIYTQKKNYHLGKINMYRIKKLEAITEWSWGNAPRKILRKKKRKMDQGNNEPSAKRNKLTDI